MKSVCTGANGFEIQIRFLLSTLCHCGPDGKLSQPPSLCPLYAQTNGMCWNYALWWNGSQDFTRKPKGQRGEIEAGRVCDTHSINIHFRVLSFVCFSFLCPTKCLAETQLLHCGGSLRKPTLAWVGSVSRLWRVLWIGVLASLFSPLSNSDWFLGSSWLSHLVLCSVIFLACHEQYYHIFQFANDPISDLQSRVWPTHCASPVPVDGLSIDGAQLLLPLHS